LHIKARPEDQGGVATAKSGGAAGQDSVDLADGLGVHSRTRRPAGLAQRMALFVIRQGEQHQLCTFNLWQPLFEGSVTSTDTRRDR